MTAAKAYVMYARHRDRKLQREVRSQAVLHDLTLSAYVVAAVRYFLSLSPEARKRALAKYGR